ncbi:MAG: Hsp20/alpha crystallin family protein [Nitrososphaeraceae archaeon]|jgi:HSP20 family molecular chaperone IbpA|nr:Hsp20/alpha crystallin family protein [Nitrososphaeraceae archaeon]MDW0140925.1 Hsp20/alpha crystallin family protein [Nitrososphaeraceae archaeon]
MLAIDMKESGDDLVGTIDLPGFTKEDINLRVICNVLYISAKREQTEAVQDRQKGSGTIIG